MGRVEKEMSLGAFDANCTKAEVADGTGQFSSAAIAAVGMTVAIPRSRSGDHSAFRKLVIDARDHGCVDTNVGTADELSGVFTILAVIPASSSPAGVGG